MKNLIVVSLVIAVTSSYAAEVLKVSQSIKATKQIVANDKVQIKYLNDVFAKANSEDFNDQKKLLDQLSFLPSHKDPATGVQIFKVTKVAKGSLFEREGLKVGDLIANGSAPEKLR